MSAHVRILRRLARSWVAGAALLLLSLLPGSAISAATLTLEDGRDRLTFDTAALLARPDLAEIEIPADVAYRRPQRYRAVPLAALLAALPAPPGSVLEAVATDGFVAQIPLSLALGTAPGAARAWLAIEPPDAPWPPRPNKQTSAGPFYIVWEHSEASRISSKYWPYQLATLRYVPAPAARWPQITVDPSLPADHPARAGQEVFAALCLVCHRLNGGGSSEMGPDLNLPMNPTEYFQLAALRRFLRDPASVRTWPEQKMPGFGPQQLSEADLDALIAYLEHMAERRMVSTGSTPEMPR